MRLAAKNQAYLWMSKHLRVFESRASMRPPTMAIGPQVSRPEKSFTLSSSSNFRKRGSGNRKHAVVAQNIELAVREDERAKPEFVELAGSPHGLSITAVTVRRHEAHKLIAKLASVVRSDAEQMPLVQNRRLLFAGKPIFGIVTENHLDRKTVRAAAHFEEGAPAAVTGRDEDLRPGK